MRHSPFVRTNPATHTPTCHRNVFPMRQRQSPDVVHQRHLEPYGAESDVRHLISRAVALS